MAATTPVREFLHGVSTALMDMQPQYARWPEVELVRYLNWGQRAIAKYLPQAGARVDAIKLAAGSRQDLTKVLAANIKPGAGVAAADTYGITLVDVVRNMGANGQTPGRSISVIDRQSLDSIDPDWHTREGSAVREYVTDPRTPLVFYVTPTVAGTWWIEVSWMAEPKQIPAGGAPGSEVYKHDGASNEVLGIADQFIDDLHNYVMAVALQKGSKNVQNIPKSQVHAGLFLSSINAQASVITGVSPNLKQLPFAGQVQASSQ